MEELVFCYPLGKLNFSDSGKKPSSYRVMSKDKRVLRELAKEKAEIAALPVHKEKIDLWKKLNNLEKTRPLVWINEIPWHELDVDDELKNETSTEFSRFLETRLRRTIYQWKHMRVDMVVEPTLPCYYTITDSGFEISENVHVSKTDEASDIYSREFVEQIKGDGDIEKIKIPVVGYDVKTTEDEFQSMSDIFDGILVIEKKGMPGFWFAPWDELIRWWGVQSAMYDMVDRPNFVHRVMQRLTDAYLKSLDQYESLNLLALNNCNYRIGSGGLSYTDELPSADFDQGRVRTRDMWGCGAAQIFSGISPQMHYEFALQYEIRWMERVGLNYYGCCEPLDNKIDLLRKIPNLRKISMSPWVDLDGAAERLGRDFVFSWKPSPAIFMYDTWNIESIRTSLAGDLKKLEGCAVEVILKDISSVRYQPRNLWEWAKIAVEEAEKAG